MKSLIGILKIGLVALVATGFGFTGQATAQPGVSVPVESFYNELTPYGQWTQHPGYGSVWLPNAGPDFQPYASEGHWVVTEFGNTWVSDYAWGWAPFHYGRWIFDQAYGGWLWIPGSDWGPAWVSWRSGGGYYGWAPLGPGINIDININIPAPYWTFVPQIYITSPQLYSYRVARPRVINIYQNTTIINNVYRSNNHAYVYGPQRVEIERVTRRPVQVYRIDPLDRPGRSVVGNGSVGFYRPNPGSNYGGNGRGYGNDNGRGYGTTNRGYNDNSRPGSAYNGRNDRNTNGPNPNYGGSYPNNNGSYPNYGGYNDRRGGVVNPSNSSPAAPDTPPVTSYPTPNRSDRSDANRDQRYNSPGPQSSPNPQPSGGFSQPRGRSYEQNQPSAPAPQNAPGYGVPQQGQRSGGGSLERRTPESQPNSYPQQSRESGQRGGPGYSSPGARQEATPNPGGGGGGRQRGPR